MRIVFMGTPDYAVPCLDLLVEKGHEVIAVVTQPDKPVGRKQSVPVFPPVKEAAIKLGIPNILQPEKVRTEEFIGKIKELTPELIITIAYGKIIPKAILELPTYGCINVHGSLLPKYRGAAPIQWSIINGDKVTGVTTMYMDEGMDTGDILLKKETEISDSMTYIELYEKLKELSAEVLEETLEELKKGNLVRITQNQEEATTVPIMKKEMGLIDWNKTAWEIHNLVRGTNPWPGAYTFYKGSRLKIWQTEVVREEVHDIKSTGTPGKIIKITKIGMIADTGKGLLKVLQVQFENSRKMHISECGHNMDEGETLG